MQFTKMQGCGNDYIYVNCFAETVPDPSRAAIRLSDRHFGIGGDGLVLICPSERAPRCAATPSAAWASMSMTAV